MSRSSDLYNRIQSLNEMTPKYGYELTQLPNMTLYCSPKQGKHGPRIKVGRKPNDIPNGRNFSVSISDNPKVLVGDTKGFSKSELATIARWIVLHKDILLDFWYEIIDADEFEQRIINFEDEEEDIEVSRTSKRTSQP